MAEAVAANRQRERERRTPTRTERVLASGNVTSVVILSLQMGNAFYVFFRGGGAIFKFSLRNQIDFSNWKPRSFV